MWAAVYHGRQNRKLACKVMMSDILRVNQSYFLWITFPLISLQINLVVVGDCWAFLCCICGVFMRERVSALLLCHFIAFFFFNHQ